MEHTHPILFYPTDDRERIIAEADRQIKFYQDLIETIKQERDTTQLEATNLLMACKAAVAALTQRATFPEDIDVAVKWLNAAIAKATPSAETESE